VKRKNRLQRDAERYRWLRKNSSIEDEVDVSFIGANEDGVVDAWYSLFGDELDAEIDARMRDAEMESKQ